MEISSNDRPNFQNAKSFVIENGKRWYYRLIPQPGRSRSGYFRCLNDEYPEETLEHKIVVGKECIKKDGKRSRMFAVFDSYVELFLYQNRYKPAEKNFYEIIIGKFPQKPHFDIDIKEDEIENFGDSLDSNKDLDSFAKAVKDNLIECAIKVCSSVRTNIDISHDVLVYQSHSRAHHDKQKRSFHVVLHHYCHADHHQAAAFYKRVIDEMKPEFANYVDHSVYSSRQNFRLLGHQKINSNRPKLFQNPMLYKGKVFEHKYDIDFDEDPENRLNLLKVESLKESLVSWVEDCEYLPAFETEEERTKKKNYEDLGDLSIETITEAKLILDQKNFPFVIRDIKGPIISLRRLRPSFCEVCQRTHEHENPYLLIVEDNIYFCCRRTEGKKLLLGKAESNLKKLDNLLEENGEEEDDEDDGFFLDLGGYVPETVPESPSLTSSSSSSSPIHSPLRSGFTSPTRPQLKVVEKAPDALDMLNQSNLVPRPKRVDCIKHRSRIRKQDHIRNRRDRTFFDLELPEIRPARGHM